MEKENNPLYIALNLLDVNFYWRWLNHSQLIDLIFKNDDYSMNFDLQMDEKLKVLEKIVKIGYPTLELTDSEIYKFFIQPCEQEAFYLINSYDIIPDLFKTKNKFSLNEAQVLEIIDIYFMLSDNITRKTYSKINKKLKSGPQGQRQLYKYYVLAKINRTFEALGYNDIKYPLDFMRIQRKTFRTWKNREIDGYKNEDLYNKIKEMTSTNMINKLTPHIQDYIKHIDNFRADHDISSLKKKNIPEILHFLNYFKIK